MSKLEELIQELCPDGIQWKKIGELADYRRGSFPQPYGNKEWYDGEGSMPFVQVADIGDNLQLVSDTNKKISTKAQPKSVFAPKGTVVVSLQGSIGRVAITQYDAFIDRTVAIFQNLNSSVNTKYFVYQLQRIFEEKAKTARGSTIKTITKAEFTEFLLPIPPLEVQQEIVRLLDDFTAKTAELQEELNKEFEARKKQYECYRDSLLNGELDKLIQPFCPDEIEYKFFGDCAKIIRGASPRPIKNFITAESGGVNWIKIGDVKPGEKYITASAEKITLEGAKKSRPVKKGDFILSNSMSFGRPYILKIDGCVHDGWLVISEFSESYTSDFLYYLLSSNMCQNQMKKKASFGGAVQNLKADTVRELFLPVPPLKAQQKIVHFLDELSIKIAKIQDELLEELESRQKQYEYYRDKLLTFKELNESEVN